MSPTSYQTAPPRDPCFFVSPFIGETANGREVFDACQLFCPFFLRFTHKTSLPSFNFPFVFNDYSRISGSPVFRSASSPSGVVSRPPTIFAVLSRLSFAQRGALTVNLRPRTAVFSLSIMGNATFWTETPHAFL